MLFGARRIKSEKLREHLYRERYIRSLEGKGVEWDAENNVEHMWKQVKWAMVESAREVCDSVRVRGKNTKSVCRNNDVKAPVRRKEVLGARDEEAKERCMEAYREEKRKIKRCIYQSRKKVNEQFGRKMNEDVNGNRKLFWEEVSNAKGGKVKSCSRIKDVNGSFA